MHIKKNRCESRVFVSNLVVGMNDAVQTVLSGTVIS